MVDIGVVSWGSGCASTYPGVFARISKQIDWIEDMVCNKLSPEDCVNGKLLQRLSEKMGTTSQLTTRPTRRTTKQPTPRGVGNSIKRSPTKKPTRAPTRKPTRRPTAAPTGTAGDDCKDRDSFSNLSGTKTRDCEWVAKRMSVRCLSYEEVCPETCNIDRCQTSSS